MVLVIGAPAVALKYQDDAPNWAGCPGSSTVFWEFTDDYCSPTSDEADPAYYYDPEPEDELVFGSRHYNQPDAGWGFDDDEVQKPWTWANGIFTVLSEDSFNQPKPVRTGKYLRQYFQVVHTMPNDPHPRSVIGVGVELWNLSLVQLTEGGWTGCPQGYEDLPGIGEAWYGTSENSEPAFGPTPIPGAEGWYRSIWIADFDEDGTLATGQESITAWYDEGLDLVTHTTCIIGMDIEYDEDDGGGGFDIEEVILDFIWFNESDGSDIPQAPCFRPGKQPPVTIDVNDIPIYEPKDGDGPEPMGPTDGQIQVNLKWQPSVLVEGDPCYLPFTCTVMVDPDPNQENAGSPDFSFTKPTPPDPNGNVYLTFDETNWNQYQNVHVEATEDLLKEGDEGAEVIFTITIDIADPNFGGPGYDPVETRMNLNVIDNDIPYISVTPYTNFMNVLTEDDPCVSRCVDVVLSHLPTDDVEVLVSRESSDYAILLKSSMSVVDPPLGVADDPNRLTFTVSGNPTWNSTTMTSNWNEEQTICLEARDNNALVEVDKEWIRGEVIFDGLSDDVRYQSKEEDGELKATKVYFNVQDNECGAWGYAIADVAGRGANGDEPDCNVDLADMAVFVGEWLFCTEPYDGGVSGWVDCDALWNLL